MRARDGDTVEAKILGFLPGKRVLLSVPGQTLVALTDLPLVRGQVVRAVVESAGSATRLRVVGKPAPSEVRRHELKLSCSGAEMDDLDRLVAQTAADMGFVADGNLLHDIREQLKNWHDKLRMGPVPLDQLRGTVVTLLGLKSRGLQPSPRILSAMDVGLDARLGTALSRLIENLNLTGRAFNNKVGRALEGLSVRLNSFFVDVEAPALAARLETALRRCGYAYEEKLVRRGISGWGMDAPAGEDDLKENLLWLWTCLRELDETGVAQGREASKGGLVRSLAWCGRTLEIIEGIQIRNLNGTVDSDSDRETSFQLPVRWQSRTGTLFLSFSPTRSRLWLDLQDVEPTGAELESREERRDLRVFRSNPAPTDRSAEQWLGDLSGRIRSAFGGIGVRLEHSGGKAGMRLEGMEEAVGDGDPASWEGRR